MASHVEGVTFIRCDTGPFHRSMRRVRWKFEELIARNQARRAKAHADWFCSLPPAKRWVAMVFGL